MVTGREAKDVVHSLYAHELYKLQERQAFQVAEQARLTNRVARTNRRARLTRSTRPEKNATKLHQARNLASL